MVLWVVWVLLFPLMVVVSLLGGSLLLFDCGLGLVYCHAASCMLLCHGCSFCKWLQNTFLLHSPLMWPCSPHLKHVGPLLSSVGFDGLLICRPLRLVSLVVVLWLNVFEPTFVALFRLHGSFTTRCVSCIGRELVCW